MGEMRLLADRLDDGRVGRFETIVMPLRTTFFFFDVFPAVAVLAPAFFDVAAGFFPTAFFVVFFVGFFVVFEVFFAVFEVFFATFRPVFVATAFFLVVFPELVFAAAFFFPVFFVTFFGDFLAGFAAERAAAFLRTGLFFDDRAGFFRVFDAAGDVVRRVAVERFVAFFLATLEGPPGAAPYEQNTKIMPAVESDERYAGGPPLSMFVL